MLQNSENVSFAETEYLNVSYLAHSGLVSK